MTVLNGTSSSSAAICAQRGRDAGAEIDLAGIDGHHALRVDGEERVDFGQRQRLRPMPCAQRFARPAGEREADDERAAALEQVAA